MLSFLTLLLARIVKLLENHYADNTPVFGSMTCTKAYRISMMHISRHLLMLLDSRSSFDSDSRKLKLDISKSPRTSFFAYNNRADNICMYYNPLNNDYKEAGVITEKKWHLL